MYLTLHLSIFHLSFLSLGWSALDFFFLCSSSVSPHLYSAEKLSITSETCHLPAPPWSLGDTFNNMCPTTGVLYLLVNSVRRLTIYFYTVFLKKSSIKKCSGMGTVLKLLHSEQRAEIIEGATWSFLSWYSFYIAIIHLLSGFPGRFPLPLVFQKSVVFGFCPLTSFSFFPLFLCLYALDIYSEWITLFLNTTCI